MADPREFETIKLSPTLKMVLFANPLSGSNKAKKFLKLTTKSLSFEVGSTTIKLYLYELTSEMGRLSGIQKIDKLLEKSEDKIKVLVAGGDGSLIWVIEELLKACINTHRVDFGILPYGTGNDLSFMLG